MTIRDEPIMKLASMLLVTNPRAVSQGPTWQIILSKYNRNQGFANRVKRKWFVVNINKHLMHNLFV